MMCAPLAKCGIDEFVELPEELERDSITVNEL